MGECLQTDIPKSVHETNYTKFSLYITNCKKANVQRYKLHKKWEEINKNKKTNSKQTANKRVYCSITIIWILGLKCILWCANVQHWPTQKFNWLGYSSKYWIKTALILFYLHPKFQKILIRFLEITEMLWKCLRSQTNRVN